MEKLVKLFEPGKIGTMELKNRIIMAPMGSMSYVTEPGGYSTDAHIAFYAARAAGGTGFIQLSNRVVSSDSFQPPEHLSRSYNGPLYNPGLLSIEDEDHIPGARRFTQAMHTNGAKIGFSVAHFGVMLARALRARPPETRPDLVRVVAPSAIRDPYSGRTPEPLGINEIQEMVEDLGQGAKRGKAAGFDAVRIQGCHGYLIHQFLSPRTNQRKDEYGGSLVNRARFGCEIVRRVRTAVGPDFPIIFRMNGDDFLEGGITLEDALQMAPLFVEAGADALDVSGAPSETRYRGIPTMYQPYGTMVHLAAAVKKVVRVPVIATGKLYPLLGERILQEGAADFIQMARPLIADPDLVNKAREGKLKDIIPCIYCNQCLERQGPALERNARYCTVNPAVGRELEYKVEPARSARKVMVIGGGPGGMKAAQILAERGHDTSLYEKSDKLGGQWNILAAYRPEVGQLTQYLSREIKKAGVKVHLKEEVSRQMVEDMKPDAVVVATGAIPLLPDVPGIQGKNVVLAADVLSGKAEVGQEVVIVGGRLVGLDTALFLAERGKSVSVVTRSKIARGIGHTFKMAIMENIIKYGVRLYPHSTLDSVTPKGINIIWDSSEPTMKQGEKYELLFLKADTVILAMGSKSDRKLGEQLTGFLPEVYIIGDSVEPRSIFDAIQEGSAVGNKI